MSTLRRVTTSFALALGLGLTGVSPGVSAAPVPQSELPADFSVADASAVSPTDTWVVGAFISGQSEIEHWDGTTWTQQELPPLDSPRLSQVQAIGPDDVWVLGTDPSADGRLFLHFDGESWSTVDSPSFGAHGGTLRALTAAGPDDVWAVGVRGKGEQGGHAVAEHWDGRRWSVVPTPRTRSTIWTQYENASAVSASDVWVVGFSYNVVDQVGHRFVTHWDGSSWSRSRGVKNPSSIRDITAIGPNDVWIAASVGSQSLMQHWDGSTWSAVPSPGPGLASAVQALDGSSSTDVWGVGTALTSEKPDTWEPMILHWDGSTWTLVAVTGERGHKDALVVVSADATDDAWTFGSTGTHRIVRHWDGQTWS